MLVVLNLLPTADKGTSWWQWLLQQRVLPIGWAAPFATPVLGLFAIDRIRHSKGRIYGLSLATFDVAFFLLLTLDSIIFGICLALNRQINGRRYIRWRHVSFAYASSPGGGVRIRRLSFRNPYLEDRPSRLKTQ